MADSFEMTGDLIRSPRRIRILEILQDRGTLTHRELKDELGCARTTVHRNLEQLQEYGWVDETPDGIGITTSGEFVCEEATTLMETIETTEKLEPVLKHVSRADLDLDITKLRDAEVIGQARSHPMAMVDRTMDAVKQSDVQRAILPICNRHHVEVAKSRTESGEISGEYILSSNVIDAIKADPEYAELIDEVCESDLVLSIYEEEMPFYLGIFDSMVQIGVEDEGAPKALIESRSADIENWAEHTFEEYLADAEPLSEYDHENVC